MNLIRIKKILFVILIFSSLCSCGYQFSGSGRLPENIQSVYIDVFENNSSETRLESIFSNDLIDEFTKRDKRLLKRKDTADAFLEGKIKSVSLQTVSHSDINSTFQQQVVVVVDIDLISRETNAIIWKRKNITESETYDVSQGSRFDTDQNRREALERISERFAETAYKLLTEDF